MAGNRLVGINFTTNDDIYPYPALKYNFSPQNMVFPLKKTFQRAGNRYLKAGNRLVGHNLVSYDDIYPYPASKYDFCPYPNGFALKIPIKWKKSFLKAGNRYLMAGKWVGVASRTPLR